MRTIDADRLIKSLKEKIKYLENAYNQASAFAKCGINAYSEEKHKIRGDIEELEDMVKMIENQPTVGMMPKKEIPKTPILITDAYGNGTLCCPNCKEPARSKWIGILPKYCQECGQKFKWEE